MYFQTRQKLALTQHIFTTESKRIKCKLFIKRLKGIVENNKRWRIGTPNKIRLSKTHKNKKTYIYIYIYTIVVVSVETLN